MARRIQWVALLLAGAVLATGCAATREQVPRHTEYDEISSYYDDLDDYGTWVDVATYGAVWCPDGLSSSWQPYTVGYWVSTYDGWLWVSEDPWGGVPYHYGRWAFDGDYGWVWVPGDVWAPAWVAWRYGSGWVGWAPLPPDIAWQVNVGIEHYGSDLDRYIDSRYWSFTDARDFGTQRKRVRVERSSDKNFLLKQTRNVTRYAAGPRPVEEGMRPDLIKETRGKKIERYRIVDATKPVSKQGLEIRGRQVEVHRPRVDVSDLTRARERARVTTPRKSPKPDSRAIERARPDREDRGEPEGRVTKPRVSSHQPAKEKERELGAEVVLEPGRREKVEARARNEIKERDKRVVEVGERQGPALREKVAETARGREEAARQREVAARQREEASRQREEVARQREVDTQQREEAARKRERAQDSEKSPPSRERSVREPEERVREKSTPPADLRERRENAAEGKGSSKGRTRGR